MDTSDKVPMKKLPCGHCGTGLVRVRNLKARGSLEHGSCECKSRLCGTCGVKMYKPANLREHKGVGIGFKATNVTLVDWRCGLLGIGKHIRKECMVKNVVFVGKAGELKPS